MHHGLTKFKNGVVANFVTVKKSDKVLFILDGLPGGSDKNQVTEAFAKKGYFVIHPRYKGTWASQGRFLNHSPAKDILNLLPLLPLGFVDYWSGKKFRIRPKKIYVVGASFGGMVSLISALDRRITKVVAFSPVISWTAETKQEPLSRLYKLLREAYGPLYRFSDSDWKKAKRRTWLNPIGVAKKINKDKVLMIYSKDDPSIPYSSMKTFVEKNGCKSILLSRGGHLSSSLYYKRKRINKEINKFLK